MATAKRQVSLYPRTWWAEIRSLGSTDAVYTPLVYGNLPVRVEDVRVLLRGWSTNDNATVTLIKTPAEESDPAGSNAETVATLALTFSGDGNNVWVDFDLSALDYHSIRLEEGETLYAFLDIGSGDTITSPVEINYVVRTWVK